MTIDTANEVGNGKVTGSAFQEYARLLRALHALIADGKGDDDETEHIRDLMDDPWDQLSEQEVRQVRGLSADLYTINDPPPPPQGFSQKEIDDFDSLVENARSNNDWDRVLELLRSQPNPHPPDRIAFLRAQCWDHLGDLETAQHFLEKAISLNPKSESYTRTAAPAIISTEIG